MDKLPSVYDNAPVDLVSGQLEPSGEECEACGAQMYGLHCKLVCPNCGYRRDCSDP